MIPRLRSETLVFTTTSQPRTARTRSALWAASNSHAPTSIRLRSGASPREVIFTLSMICREETRGLFESSCARTRPTPPSPTSATLTRTASGWGWICLSGQYSPMSFFRTGSFARSRRCVRGRLPPAGAAGRRAQKPICALGMACRRDWRALEPEEKAGSSDEDALEPAGVTRRRFVKVIAGAGVVAGVLGLGALSGLRIVYRPPDPPPPWEIAPGVVDYTKVPERQLTGPTPNILKVAQWYDYWPGSFKTDFTNYMAQTYGLTVSVQQDTFTSNEELFEWITLGGKKYDVIFPTNHIVDNIKKSALIYNLNLAWIPNFANLWSDFIRVPHHVDSPDNLDQRQDPNGLNYVSIPYFWGTTGIAWRKDQIPKDEVDAIGLDFFTMASYSPQAAGYPTTVTLDGKMRMLEDQRDVFTFGAKKAGWTAQQANGLTPSPYVGPYTDTTGKVWPGTQWTSNETASERVNAMGDWLFQCKPHLFDFNSTGDTPSLIAGVAVLNQAWSGDIAYAQRPDQSNPQPADYIIPYQGSRWWQDTCVIPSKCRNLWLAHEFINFIHSVSSDWPENQLLTKWNLYPTPNKACFDLLTPFANGYDMRADPRLYPNLLAPDDWNRCDLPRDVGADVLVKEYNPLWFNLTSV